MNLQLSISSDMFKKSITKGLSQLQQNGEMVDMTLAADGHLVKVHQIVMALASPFIKELIASAPCPHPVIFLNKVSFTTLSSLLEYVYTGEVMLDKDNLPDLIEAARELHISGLESVKVEIPGQQVSRPRDEQPISIRINKAKDIEMDCTNKENPNESFANLIYEEEILDDDFNSTNYNDVMDSDYDTEAIKIPEDASVKNIKAQVQYTAAKQGGLQMILNRYIYTLDYTTKTGLRSWRCTNKNKTFKCKAKAVTRNDMVIKRCGVHNHPRHDKRILKKVRENAVFATLNDFEHHEQTSEADPNTIPDKDRDDNATDTE